MENALAETDVSKGHPQEEEREGDGEAGQDGYEKERQQDKAEEFEAHGALRPK